MKTRILILLKFCLILFWGCSSYTSKNNVEANNSTKPAEIVLAHLRAIEAGDWETANSYLADHYKMKMAGMPFFIHIKKKDALNMHKARKMAFPDFRFNEKVEQEKDNQVRVAIFLTGIHKGLLDYPKNVGVPKTEATGKSINLPAEYFTYSVENNKIVYTYGYIPEGHGPAALIKQLGIEKKKNNE